MKLEILGIVRVIWRSNTNLCHNSHLARTILFYLWGALKYLLTIFLIFCSLFSKGQNPLMKMWDKRFGGTAEDRLFSFQQSKDGGYILAGVSNSGVNGNKTQPNCNAWSDYWIVKIDSLGNKEWDNQYGGGKYDILQSIKQTFDGGYILGGYSDSPLSCDKTQSNWDTTYMDYWIVKIDSVGNQLWDKRFGGTNDEYLTSIFQTADRGYILGGYSNSGISGDKTQPVCGGNNNYDYWVIKIDSLGNKQWDKDIGGNEFDFLYSAQQTTEGGYILGGYSRSDSGGDKTQANWDLTGLTYDYWIVKLDSLGNKKWDKVLGGIYNDALHSLQETSDFGFILGGRSESGIGGDKTQPVWGIAGTDYDYWIIKTDSLGNKQWDKDFGGSGIEELCMVSLTSDGGYLISGDSYSPISGDKTESNLGAEQTWLIKTDSVGNKQWDKTIFTVGHDEQGLAIQSSDDCFAIVNNSEAAIGGYKTQNAWSNNFIDYWMVKFCPTIQSLFIAPSFLCPGACTSFLNLSTNATTYQWSFPGATPDTSTSLNPTNICYANPGSYDVQLIAFNANGSDTLLLTNYINVFPSPPPQSITQSGDTLFAFAGAGTYQWYFNTNIINGATNYFYVAQSSGDYNVVAADNNGCEVEAAVFNVVASVYAIEDHDIMIFPNPVEDKFTMHNLQCTIGAATEISIYNVIGEKMSIDISSAKIRELYTEIDVHTLPAGLYYLEIIYSSPSEVGGPFHSKFVKSTYRTLAP